MARDDARRAPQLFGEHRARHQMRPGRAAEGDDLVGAFALLRREAVGGPEAEARLAPPAVAPFFEEPREFERRQLLAALTEQDRAAVPRRAGSSEKRRVGTRGVST